MWRDLWLYSSLCPVVELMVIKLQAHCLRTVNNMLSLLPFFTGNISSPPSWCCFIEWESPPCLTHHFPPHFERGGESRMIGGWWWWWGGGGAEGAQCPRALLPHSCPSSMAGQSSALGITNRQMPFPCWNSTGTSLSFPTKNERQTGVHSVYSVFNISSWGNGSEG